MAAEDWATLANSLFGGGSLGNLAAGAIAGAGYYDQMNNLRDVGTQARNYADVLGEDLYSRSQFKPFTVTSGMGSTGGWTDQGLNMQLGAQEQALQNQLLGGAQGMFQSALGSTAQREGDIYNRIRAMQQPEEQRRQQQLQNQLANQGRLGITTAQYGGTPEQLAMAKAQAEAQNTAAYQAMQQAQAEQLQQYNMGAGMLSGAYHPQAQLLNALGAGGNLAQLAQKGQLTGVGSLGELGMAGMDAYLQSQLGAGNLAGQGIGALAGLFAPRQTTLSKDGTTISGNASDWGAVWDAGRSIFEDIFGFGGSSAASTNPNDYPALQNITP